ncbi:DUF599 domain-containing protein [Epibacterium ulvae]|uniref:DUF599 domain-containing protein n=1 Tax=Epibacterium ulvae TaxID=1156985 RepID=UPI001BFC2954|nr:DUF599 domain-containing protein [Epibacterium ulvae]MBT8153809.1 DUF599 domain-containing protein [Epibacterium ulvae]
MIWLNRIALFSPLDFAGLVFVLVAWVWIGWRIEHPAQNRPSVSFLMADFRRDWLHTMVTREPRVFDAMMVGSLRQGTAFFASTTMLAIGGGLALIGNTEQVAGLAKDFMHTEAPTFVWEAKILVVLLLLCNAFLKFVWSNRLFGYGSVLMAAVPNDPDAPLVYQRAAQAAELNITAARSFNRGLRATYFSLSTCAWLIGPIALLLATFVTLAVLYRREFASRSREVLLSTPADHAKEDHSGTQTE